VDTGLGRTYRRALDERYQASHHFRRLLGQMDLFWSIPALCVGTAVTVAALDKRVPQMVAFGIGWGVPLL